MDRFGDDGRESAFRAFRVRYFCTQRVQENIPKLGVQCQNSRISFQQPCIHLGETAILELVADVQRKLQIVTVRIAILYSPGDWQFSKLIQICEDGILEGNFSGCSGPFFRRCRIPQCSRSFLKEKQLPPLQRGVDSRDPAIHVGAEKGLYVSPCQDCVRAS